MSFETRLKPKGGTIVEISLIYFPLGKRMYAFNYNGVRGTAIAELKEEDMIGSKRKRRWWEIKFCNDIFRFDGDPLDDLPYENYIDNECLLRWINDTNNNEGDIIEIFCELKSTLKVCYDFMNEVDYDIAAMFIFQSWFYDLLDAVFYVDIRSKMGGGKTLLLELFKGLCKNGVLANDISLAAIPRIIDKYGCTLLIDEIDSMGKKDEEIFKVLRAGYKKGNKYIRCKPKTFEDESFDVYSAKAFNYRSDIPDDLKNRSIPINTNKSADFRLPLISLYKRQYLIPIYQKIWMFYMNNKISLEIKVNESKRVLVNKDIDIDKVRLMPISRSLSYSRIAFFYQNLFTLFTKDELNELLDEDFEGWFTKLFANISGRNIELYAIILHLSAMLGINLVNDFKKVMEEKEEFENYDETDLKSVLREILSARYWEAPYSSSGMKYVPYRDIAKEFIRKVHDEYGFKPSTHEMKKQLRELGFVDKVNRKLIKVNNSPVFCLLFDSNVKRHLNIEDEKPSTEPLKEENNASESL